MLYLLGKAYFHTFLRLFSSHIVLLSIGILTTWILSWILLPRLWHRLPHDHGKALVPGGALGLRQDGSVAANFESFPGWTDVACVSGGSLCVLGIRSDGALLAHFFRSGDAFEIDNYTDVLAVAGGGGHSAIMTRSGQVRAFGNNEYGQCDIGWWELGE